jgi:hypothetical protein
MDMKPITTPEFRLSFADIFTPVTWGDGGDEKYRMTMLFEPQQDLSAVKQMIAAAAQAKWGDKIKDPAFASTIRNPLQSGDGKPWDGYEGMLFLRASTKIKPNVVDEDMNPVMDQSKIYSGCYCRAIINMFGYDVKGNRGVGVGFMAIQKLRDGETFCASVKVEDFFTPVDRPAGADTNVSDENPFLS